MPHVDVTLSLLGNARRRHVIRALAEGPTNVRELAERITAAEEDIALSEVDYEARQGIHTALAQVHLPKLSEHEAVIWERESGWVAPGRLHPLYTDALQSLEAIDGIEVRDEALPG